MSRMTLAPASASLTEELDKLEQSITLTLQEIDHNFSRAHAIVNSGILPIVEKYAAHSSAVWEGSKFWKKFFEASANVSLSGVEEQIDGQEDLLSNQSPENDEKYVAGSPSQSDEDTIYSEKEDDPEPHDEIDDSFLENADIFESTPRAQISNQTHKASDSTAYRPSLEDSRRESGRETHWKSNEEDIQTPQSHESKTLEVLKAPVSLSSGPTDKLLALTQNKTGPDPLLHRVLDKNYRLQATPLATVSKRMIPSIKTSWRDLESPDSSPPAAAPQLHADLFSSPTRSRQSKPATIRTPGISVFTPARNKLEKTITTTKKEEITWESDSEEDAEGIYRELGMSPPKTIQFILPQSKILQTPAREASQRIVQDLLATAGAAFDESDTEESPSIVVRNNIDDDDF